MKKSQISPLAFCLACVIFAGCGANPEPAQTAPSSQAVSEQSAPAPSEAASSAESAEAPPEEEKPQPISGSQIKDGVYGIEVSSSSSMFRIIDAQLTVTGGEMSAVLTLSGTGYGKLYMGTAEEALADTEESCIPFVENADGKYTYEVPVEALNQETDCAAWSIKKETWYDRTLIFESAQIPAESIGTAEDPAQPPADGQYRIDVALSGGTGRSGVQSPADLTVKDGAATAAVVWDSPYYENMTVNGVSYAPVSIDGNAVFEIPVSLDRDMAVTARTIAMSEPHDIDYTLRFDSATMQPVEKQ